MLKGGRRPDSAGVTLVKGDLRDIVRARRVSRATMKNIRQNLFFAVYLQRAWSPGCCRHGVSGIWATAESDDFRAAMTLSSVSVIGNALRLRRVWFTADLRNSS